MTDPTRDDAGASGFIDVSRLARWMDDQGVPGTKEQLTLTPILSDASPNALFEVCRGEERMVLRRSPRLGLHWRGDSLAREYRALRALRDTDVPHPRLLGGSMDADVVGEPFFLMERIDGWNPASGGWRPPFDSDLVARGELGLQVVEGLAHLARVDWRRHGLEGFGQPQGFHERQVEEWLGHLAKFQFRELPGLDVAAEWLRRHQPARYEPGIMHNDLRWANVLFGYGLPARLAAIIDWELATIGDPLLDLGRCLMAWPPEGADMEQFRRYEDYEGMPSREQMLERYEAVSGRPTDDIDYYVILARFTLAIPLEDSYSRFLRGEKEYAQFGEALGPLVLELSYKAGELARTMSRQR